MAVLSLAWTAAFALLGLAVLRLRMPQPARVATAAPSPATERPTSGPEPARAPSHQAAVAQARGGPGRNPGERGLTADQRVVPPPAARAGNPGLKHVRPRPQPHRPSAVWLHSLRKTSSVLIRAAARPGRPR